MGKSFVTLLGRSRLLILFVVANFLFLIFDVSVAHSMNNFAHPYEWIPIGFSALASGVGAYVFFRGLTRARHYFLFQTTMIVGVFIGVVGTAFHLSGNMLRVLPIKPSLDWIIIGDPVVAPLAYAGICLVGLLGSMIESPVPRKFLVPGLGQFQFIFSKTQLLLGLVALGFLGNFILALEHSQSDFHPPATLIPVIFSLLGFIVGIIQLFLSVNQLAIRKIALGTLVAGMLIGGIGFGFHLLAGISAGGGDLMAILYTTPLFAPMLFADLSVLWWIVMQAE